MQRRWKQFFLPLLLLIASLKGEVGILSHDRWGSFQWYEGNGSIIHLSCNASWDVDGGGPSKRDRKGQSIKCDGSPIWSSDPFPTPDHSVSSFAIYTHPLSIFYFVLSYLILASFPVSVLLLSSIVFFYTSRFLVSSTFSSPSFPPSIIKYASNYFSCNFTLCSAFENINMTWKHVYKKQLYFYDSVILSKFSNKWVLWSKGKKLFLISHSQIRQILNGDSLNNEGRVIVTNRI